MFVPAAADAVGLVQKEVPVTQGGFGILVDRHDDRLDVMVAPTFARCPLTNLSKRFDPNLIQGGWSSLGSYHLSSVTTGVLPRLYLWLAQADLF